MWSIVAVPAVSTQLRRLTARAPAKIDPRENEFRFFGTVRLCGAHRPTRGRSDCTEDKTSRRRPYLCSKATPTRTIGLTRHGPGNMFNTC